MEKPVLRIHFGRDGVYPARLPIGLGIQHQAMHRLDAPPRLDEARCQPVKQLGMRGTLSNLAEVVQRSHKTAPEMMMPETIYQDAGHERRGVRRHPLRKTQSPAAF